MTSQPFFRMSHAAVRYLLAVCWVAATLAATTVLFFGNFIVAWQAFVLLGFEELPISSVPLLGPLATAVGCGDAQIASLFAATLTLGMAATILSATKCGCGFLTLFFDIRHARLAGEENPAARIKLHEMVPAFVIALAVAVLVALFDVSLFGLRLEWLLKGSPDIRESLHWLPDSASRLGDYLAGFSACARWGYLGVIVGVAYATEKAFERAAERWLLLGQTVDVLFLGLGVDRTARVPVPARPFRPVREAAGGMAPVASHPAPAIPVPFARPEVEEPASPVAGVGSPLVEPIPGPPAPDPIRIETKEEPQVGPRVRVICGPGETREVPIHEVERDSVRYVRDGSGRAWFLRSYYDQLYGNRVEREALGLEHEDAA